MGYNSYKPHGVKSNYKSKKKVVHVGFSDKPFYVEKREGDKLIVSDEYGKTKEISVNDTAEMKSQKRYNPANVDEAQATELKIQMDNDADLYRQRLTPMRKNLINKQASGKYDEKKAEKLFEYAVTDYSRAHREDVGEVNIDTRRYVAEQYAREFESEAKDGNYDELKYKKYR